MLEDAGRFSNSQLLELFKFANSQPKIGLHRFSSLSDFHQRRFEGCNDDACKVALYIAEQRAQASKDVASIDPYWQLP